MPVHSDSWDQVLLAGAASTVCFLQGFASLGGATDAMRESKEVGKRRLSMQGLKGTEHSCFFHDGRTLYQRLSSSKEVLPERNHRPRGMGGGKETKKEFNGCNVVPSFCDSSIQCKEFSIAFTRSTVSANAHFPMSIPFSRVGAVCIACNLFSSSPLSLSLSVTKEPKPDGALPKNSRE